MKPEIPNKISFLINGKEENRIVKNYAYTIYDKEGRSIYSNTLNRSECWWEYNDAGVMIHNKEKRPDGKILEEITKFNEAGKKIYYRNDFEGSIENFYAYTEDGNLLSVTHKNGGGRFLEYDDNGKLIYQYRKNSKGEITWEEHYSYDENDNKIRLENEDDEYVDLDERDDLDCVESKEIDDSIKNVLSDDERYLVRYENGIITAIREKIENNDDTTTVVYYRL